MASVANKRSTMTLYSDPNDPYSHQVRIVLAEKGVGVEIIEVDPDNIPEMIYELNPYGTLPTLVDRDLVLYDSSVIMEYLDERFPHPPLLPVYPVARAECRRMIYRINRDWYSKMEAIYKNNVKGAETARKDIKETLVSIAPVFASKAYFLSEDFTLVDCWLAPLLWRLPELQVELPEAAKAIHKYAARVFNRESFKSSLSETELEIRGEV